MVLTKQLAQEAPCLEGDILFKNELYKHFNKDNVTAISLTARQSFDNLIKISLDKKEEINFRKWFLYNPIYKFIKLRDKFFIVTMTPFGMSCVIEIIKPKNKIANTATS